MSTAFLLAQSAFIHPNGWSGLCADQSSSSTPNANPYLDGPCFMHKCAVMLKQQEAIPNLFPEIWELEIVHMFLVLMED